MVAAYKAGVHPPKVVYHDYDSNVPINTAKPDKEAVEQMFACYDQTVTAQIKRKERLDEE